MDLVDVRQQSIPGQAFSVHLLGQLTLGSKQRLTMLGSELLNHAVAQLRKQLCEAQTHLPSLTQVVPRQLTAIGACQVQDQSFGWSFFATIPNRSSVSATMAWRTVAKLPPWVGTMTIRLNP